MDGLCGGFWKSFLRVTGNGAAEEGERGPLSSGTGRNTENLMKGLTSLQHTMADWRLGNRLGRS